MRLSMLVVASSLAFVALTCGCATLGDKDKDGIKRRDDKCPDVPEDKDGVDDYDGCPEDDQGNVTAEQAPIEADTQERSSRTSGADRDGDGLGDNLDRCPSDPEDMDGFQDDDGCPDVDNDQDGVVDMTDLCPNEPEDKDASEDEDGCPDPDNDKDGVLDTLDKCPTVAGSATNGGCP